LLYAVPKRVIIDPSAAALKVELKRRGFYTQDADNDVLNGIEDVCTMLKLDQIAFYKDCQQAIVEFGQYCWDSKAADLGIDAVVKENDHCMDSIRYFVRTKKLVKRQGKKRYQPAA